jgi:hypothetical protein
MTDERDELDQLLAPHPPAEAPGLREALLRRTERRLVVGRWVHRAGRCAALAAVFAAGIGVGLWRAPRQRETVLVPTPVPHVEVVTVPVPVVFPVPGSSAGPAPAPAVARSARELVLEAEQADDSPTAAKLYRQAGDAYLSAEQDYAGAARCYRLFLARGGVTALTPEPGDSWLLTSLKNAAFKEKVHATLSDG